jgi:hypothetical protein
MTSSRQPAIAPWHEDSVSLGNVLSSSLDMFKIENVEIRKKAVEFVGSVSLTTVNAYGKWITSIKAIADACTVCRHTFSQSELCDFLTVAAKGMDSKRAGAKAVKDSTFYIYMDIMENYQKSSSQIKLHFPRIIVDVISILDKGVDTHGEAIGVYGIERYYQERKINAPFEDPTTSYSIKPANDSRAARQQQQQSSSITTDGEITPAAFNDELVENLASITNRSKKELEESLANLMQADIKKIADLAVNYSRLQKYSKLERSEDLKTEVEKDLGRNLTDNQLQHAANSIRKAKIYIENVLDGKFVPHGTHGINHIKHNLEYGYQLMGLIEPRKRRSN